jgi:hypothetical protein
MGYRYVNIGYYLYSTPSNITKQDTSVFGVSQQDSLFSFVMIVIAPLSMEPLHRSARSETANLRTEKY